MLFNKLKDWTFEKPAIGPVIVHLGDDAHTNEPIPKPLYDEKELELVMGTLELIHG